MFTIFAPKKHNISAMNTARIPLYGMTLEELEDVVGRIGMPRFAARQMAEWLYKKHVGSVDEMTNLKKTSREALSEYYEVGRHGALLERKSSDGTAKYLFSAACAVSASDHDRSVETVFIPDGERATVCLSCQVGCRMNCLFCQTGKQGFDGNLTSNDILNQIGSLPRRDKITNIVFMGQGEPADNADNVLKAIRILTAPWGYALSPRRITVSSVGVKGKTERFVRECDCHVAISLHSPITEQRRTLVPAEGAMPIADTVEMLRRYDWTGQRRLSFEYTVFGYLNDSRAHGRAIVGLLRGLHCRINLIRYHRILHVDLPSTDADRMTALRDMLTSHGLFATIRASRGEDIDAACGMLNTNKGKYKTQDKT